MQLVKSETHDCTQSAKLGYKSAGDDFAEEFASMSDLNQGAYRIGRYLGGRMLGRPLECVGHVLKDGGTHYVVRSDTFQTGGVMAVYENGQCRILHRSALEAGYR